MVKLKLQRNIAPVNIDRLPKTQPQITNDISSHYDCVGWSNFNPDSLSIARLPSIRNPLYFSSKHSISDGLVVSINGSNYLIKIVGDELIIDLTINKPTIADATVNNFHIKFFGQPEQSDRQIYPSDSRMKPCYNLLSINGNNRYNIFVGIDLFLPTESYIMDY